MKAAVYLRISQDATGEALGVTRQREDCEALAASLGWEVVEVYVDNDISAVSGKARPAYRRMLADVVAGHVGAIVGWAPDRIYRRLIDLEELITTLEGHSVEVRTVKAGDLDLSSAYGRMLARILGAIATGEGEIKAERWLRSIRQRRETGAFPPSGPRMYGYTRDGKVIEEEALVVRWMAQQILDGTSMTGLTREVAERGLTSTLGATWRKQSIKRLLTNPKLAGYQTLNGDVIGEGKWAPILDRAQWETVRATIGANPRRPTSPRVALLAGLVFCGKCDAKMVTGSSTRKNTLKRTYRCTREPGEKGCMSVAILAEPVEEIVEAYAKARLEDPRTRDAITSLRAQPRALQQEVGDLELRITELEHQLDEPGVPVKTILRAIDRAKERQGTLMSEIVAQTPVVLPTGADWPTDLRRRRALVDIIVARVWVDPSSTPGRFDPTRVRIDGR